MGNSEKNRHAYRGIVDTFNRLTTGSSPINLESSVLRAYNLFFGGYEPLDHPDSDFGRETLRNLKEYGELSSGRRKIEIEGGEREVATEKEAYRSLVLAGDLANNLIIPFFNEENNFSNRIFKDIFNLSLAYLHGIVSAVAQEYVGGEQTYEAKKIAVKIASKGIRANDVYSEEGLKKRLKDTVKSLTKKIERAQPQFVRSFELVPTSQKKIYKGGELMKKVNKTNN